MDKPIGRCSVQDISEQVRLEQRMQNLALTDPLTGLANRRHFDERSEVELDQAMRTGSPLTALALDIDLFKKVNDTYGHAAGDEVLKALAQKVQSMLRGTDIFARMGGEEFVILLPETTIAQAASKAESLRKALAELVVSLPNGEQIQFTVSLGVAGLSENMKDLKPLLEAADEALYDAKHSGRNCVRVAKAKSDT
ncbi:MAG TPA: GGDEF domain-containing protein [Alcaligenaceae bacterium]|nr:GGDEF domain-containing protein [Alcaligenaceae bacterium]